MPRPRLSESVKYERECDKISKTFARKMFSKVKKDFKKIEHSEAIMKRKAERVLNKIKKKASSHRYYNVAIYPYNSNKGHI